MWYLIIKAAISGIIVAAVSEVAKRYPGIGGLIASLPLVSVLGMIWLWRDKPDAVNMAAHSRGTFWFVLPSLPMFLLIPVLLDRGWSFAASLSAGCGLTILLYTGDPADLAARYHPLALQRASFMAQIAAGWPRAGRATNSVWSSGT